MLALLLVACDDHRDCRLEVIVEPYIAGGTFLDCGRFAWNASEDELGAGSRCARNAAAAQDNFYVSWESMSVNAAGTIHTHVMVGRNLFGRYTIYQFGHAPDDDGEDNRSTSTRTCTSIGAREDCAYDETLCITCEGAVSVDLCVEDDYLNNG